jgi:hypothetical protein
MLYFSAHKLIDGDDNFLDAIVSELKALGL